MLDDFTTLRMIDNPCVPEWLLTGSITQLVLAIISKDTRTPLERWVFDINLVQTEGEQGTDAK